MTETTKEYFDREKESRLELMDYIESDDWEDKLNKAIKLIWDEIHDFIVYKDDEQNQEIDMINTDREWIEEAVRNYHEPLSIERRVRVNPRDPRELVNDGDDSKYKIYTTLWGPTVYWDIDRTAELHLYWWSEHYSRDFGSDFAGKLLSFYWLE